MFMGSKLLSRIRSSSGLRQLLWNSNILVEYSTSAADHEAHFMVDYLANSLGLTRKEAIAALPKVTHLKSTKRPNLVVDFLKENGLDKTQIKNLISVAPKVLLCDVHKTLKPKFDTFLELGLSRPHIAKIITADISFFKRRLHTRLVPAIEYLRKFLGSDEKVIKAINKYSLLLSFAGRRFPQNVLLLQNFGIPENRIRKLALQNPRFLLQKSEWLYDILSRVETELGISQDSAMFCHGFEALYKVSKATINRKFEFFKSFGWSDSDIHRMTKNLPSCLCLSEAKIHVGLTFFMKKLGYTSAYLAGRPTLLAFNMENRVLPRYEIWKLLKEKNVSKKVTSLCSAVCYSEEKFLKYCVTRYEDKIPNLHEIYKKMKTT